MAAPTVLDEDDLTLKHAAHIATPAVPGAEYVEAEVVALRTAIAAILVALRSANIIALD